MAKKTVKKKTPKLVEDAPESTANKAELEGNVQQLICKVNILEARLDRIVAAASKARPITKDM